jgi:hypothetical protein
MEDEDCGLPSDIGGRRTRGCVSHPLAPWLWLSNQRVVNQELYVSLM